MTLSGRSLLNKTIRRVGTANIYLTACAFYIFIRVIGASLLKNGETESLFKIFVWAAYFILAGKILLDFLSGEFRIKEICVITLISAILFLNMRVTGIKDAFIYWVFIVGSKGTNYKKVIKWAAIAHFAALFIVIGSCFIHALENVVYIQGNRIRESLGFAYTTEPANFFFYGVLLWVYARDKKIQWIELIILASFDILIFKKTGTLSAFSITLFVLCLDAVVKVFPDMRAWKLAYRWLAVLIVPCLVVFIFYTTCKYDSSVVWLDRLDQLLHSRLQLGHAAIEKYGIPAFGQRIRWIGGANAYTGKYNYVDSSFVQILINYGWVFFCLLIIGFQYFERSIYNHKDFYLLIVFCALMVHATFDPQLIWIMFNSFWLAYPYVTEKTAVQNVVSVKQKTEWTIRGAAFGLAFVAIAINITGLRPFLNKALYLDDYHQGYVNQLLEAESEYGSSAVNGAGAYLLTMVDKDGFGEVTPEDMQFFVQASKRMNPDIVRTSLCFSDKTGIEIPVTDPMNAKYGEVNANGKVLGESVSVDLSRPLLGQIDGVTLLEREYDNNMNLIYQFRCGADGIGIEDYDGNAGFYRVYDNRRHIISQKNIDKEKQPNVNRKGFSEFRREYDGEDIIWEGYFDADGKPVERKDCLYTAVSREYDQKHNCISEKYYDTGGNLTTSLYGYAEKRCEYINRKISKESFFDIEGKPLMMPAGYASRCIGYDEEGNINSVKYLDEDGSSVITTLGYAEIHRAFDGSDLVSEKYYGVDGLPLLRAGEYAEISQQWENGDLISRTYLDAEGNPIERRDGYTTAIWKRNAEGVNNVQFIGQTGEATALEGLNLATDVSTNTEGWSEWMTPWRDTENSCFNIGYANLGPKAEGDSYSSQVEIEFKGVSSEPGKQFLFLTQGAQDGKWTVGNVWNGELVNLNEVPEDGVYSFTSTVVIDDNMAKVSRFDLGFRCDYWASGSFRVRNVKVEKGDTATEWSPGV